MSLIDLWYLAIPVVFAGHIVLIALLKALTHVPGYMWEIIKLEIKWLVPRKTA
jgi:hypothetical protein